MTAFGMFCMGLLMGLLVATWMGLWWIGRSDTPAPEAPVPETLEPVAPEPRRTLVTQASQVERFQAEGWVVKEILDDGPRTTLMEPGAVGQDARPTI